jgi:hypothetical protein
MYASCIAFSEQDYVLEPAEQIQDGHARRQFPSILSRHRPRNGTLLVYGSFEGFECQFRGVSESRQLFGYRPFADNLCYVSPCQQ